MWVKLRHKIVFAIFRVVFAVYLFFKYGYIYTKFKCGIKKPYLILANHFTGLDPFMVAMSFKSPVYFIASDDIFSIKYISSIIKFLVAPIPKTKSSQDLQTIRDCYKIASQGGNICVFPEGNRTFNGVTTFIPFAVVKLVKMLKLPMLIYRLEGGYGVQPRWAGKLRRGRMYGRVHRVLTYDQYKSMPDDDLYKYITDNLYINSFDEAEQSGRLYKSSKKAEYIERFLYACPQCKSFNTIYSQKNQIICTKCDLRVKYNENLKLTVLSGKCNFENVKQWDDFQKDEIRAYDIKNADLIFFDDNVLLRENIRCKKKINMAKGQIRLYKDKITSHSGINFYIKDIDAVAVFGKNRLQFYCKDKIYQLIGGKRFNALKYQNMIYHIKNTQEGITDGFLGL